MIFYPLELIITHQISKYSADTEIFLHNKCFEPRKHRSFSTLGENKGQSRPILQFAGVKKCPELRQSACFLDSPQLETFRVIPSDCHHLSKNSPSPTRGADSHTWLALQNPPSLSCHRCWAVSRPLARLFAPLALRTRIYNTLHLCWPSEAWIHELCSHSPARYLVKQA